MSATPVKVSLLQLLEAEPKRYSDVVRELGRPDKTVYVTLTALVDSKFVAKNDEGKYVLTDAGRRELERIRFVRMAEEEDDVEIISNTRTAIALGRCYDLLFDIRYLLSRTPKAEGEERRAVSERMNIVRNLLLKYNPSLKKDELLKEEKKGLDIGIADLVSGGIWWGKRFVKWGLKDRYIHLVNLTRELPEGPVKDEILASLALFREVAGKLDNRLKELVPHS
jgi:DNA-binding PadR family transcriptional regulator